MSILGRLPIVMALGATLLGCGDGASDEGIQNDSGNYGYLVIGQNQPLLSSENLLSFRTAQAWTISHELVIGGQRLTEEYLDSTRSFFSYSGFASNVQKDFELKFIGAYQGQRVELLSATGTHTFKTYVASTCKPSREDDCSNVQESDETSTSIEQVLEISQVVLLHCDDDTIDNLTEIYFDTDPCGASLDQPQGEVTAAVPTQPTTNAVLEKNNSYTFDFQSSADTQHINYQVQIFGGASGTTLLGRSALIPVLANQAADYSASVSVNLSAGNNYNWRVFAFGADQSSRPLSPSRSFSIANAVPSLTATLPNENAVLPFVEAAAGHQFRFNSTTDTGVQEYRVHLTDETNSLDYGYKRIYANNNDNGGDYATYRNLALKQGGRHRWYVSANNASGEVLAQTPIREFTIESVQTVNRVLSLSAPANNASLIKVIPDTGYNFSFSSNTNQDVAEYRVYLRDTSDGNNYGYKRVSATQASNYTVTRNLNLTAGDNHAWYVTANNAAGEQLDQSPERSFNIQAPQVSTALDISDSRNTATREYHSSDVGHAFYFSSDSDTGVSTYRVYVAENDGPDYSYKIVNAGTSATGNSYNTTRNLALNAGRSHRFYVSAHDADGNELGRSTVTTFTIESAAELTITPTSPSTSIPWASQSIGYPFSFTVSNDANVASYQVHVQDTETPINFFHKNVDAAANTVNGVVTTTRNINTNANVNHDWYVTAHDAGGVQLARSAKSSFTPNAYVVTNLAPATGSTVAHSSTGYDFNFRSVDNAGVAEYRLHVFDITNDDGSFGYIIIQPNVATGPSDYSVHRNINLKVGSQNRWRVAALDAAGFEMSTTEWLSFNIPQ